MKLARTQSWLLTLSAPMLFTAFAHGAELNFTRHSLQLPVAIENLLVADVNNDGLNDLVAVVDDVMRIYFQSASGFDFATDFTEFAIPGTAVGWDLSTNYSAAGTAIIALVEGREVLAWQIEGRDILAPRVIKSDLTGYLGRGINRLHFSRDINNDGRDDLIIPGAGELQLYLQDAAGDYLPPLPVKTDVQLRSTLDSSQLERRTGQAIVIPTMQLRDVNADGAADIISRTEERLDVFLANKTGTAYFPTVPTYSINIAEIEARLGEFDVDSLDFSNLTGVLALTHEEILEDVDGDGIEDLLLREGGKVSLFGGTATGMDLSQPRQVLRSGGNVLSTFLYDENADGLKDLWLWRIESISVGDIFVWLALSGSIAIEAFIYPNEGDRFARRPTRQITVDLKFPSAIRLATSVRDIRNEVESTETSPGTPTSVANLDADASSLELLVLLNRQLQVFLNSITPEPETRPFLGSLGYTRQRNNYEIDIRRIIDNLAVNRNPLLEQVSGKTADYIIDLTMDVTAGDVIPMRLNNDAVDDLFLFTDFDEDYINGVLLLSTATGSE